ncbi:MAG: hypothetical protein ABJA79_08680 [Parafilimonas sp.]
MSQQINDKIYTPYTPTDADYEKAEMDLLYTALKRSYTQRFEMMMILIKTGIMLKNAKIYRTPVNIK